MHWVARVPLNSLSTTYKVCISGLFLTISVRGGASSGWVAGVAGEEGCQRLRERLVGRGLLAADADAEAERRAIDQHVPSLRLTLIFRSVPMLGGWATALGVALLLPPPPTWMAWARSAGISDTAYSHYPLTHYLVTLAISLLTPATATSAKVTAPNTCERCYKRCGGVADLMAHRIGAHGTVLLNNAAGLVKEKRLSYWVAIVHPKVTAELVPKLVVALQSSSSALLRSAALGVRAALDLPASLDGVPGLATYPTTPQMSALMDPLVAATMVKKIS